MKPGGGTRPPQVSISHPLSFLFYFLFFLFV
jgi:hypothetical protein